MGGTMAYVNYNGPGGGDFTISDSDQIGEVNGPADWHIFADTDGRDLTIANQKDGDGSLTLTGFGAITIANQKNGAGNLIVEDSKSIDINHVDGPGSVYLRFPGRKVIHWKNGGGNIYYTGKPPIVQNMDGPGKVIKEA
jgi:hypothetical protein